MDAFGNGLKNALVGECRGVAAPLDFKFFRRHRKRHIHGQNKFDIDRLGGRLVGSNGGWLASLGLGAIFAIGWTPCIGIILGGILTMAATSGTVAQGTVLLIAYCLGLGLPFIVIALALDRAPGLLRPLLRHGRTVSLIGGLLVAAIGVAMVLDLLRLAPQYFQFLTAI